MNTPRLNLLVAYPYMSKGVVAELHAIHRQHPDTRFLLDSGAFTAFNAGKTITLDDYCSFLESLPFKPWRYFALDVINDAEATQRNYEVMLARGFSPVPVFTQGEDLSVIDELYQTSDYIGVGGLVGMPHTKMLHAVDQVMKKVGQRKCHLLGFTRMEYLKKFRPYSCDSSSWESGARFGQAYFYKGAGQFLKLTKKDMQKPPTPETVRLAKSHGIGLTELASATEGWSGGNSVIRRSGGASWIKCSIDIERNIRTRLFLACATDNAIRIVRSAYENELNLFNARAKNGKST